MKVFSAFASVVCLAFFGASGIRAQAPGTVTSGAAKLLSMQGQVSVLRDSAPWALNIGDFVQPQQIVVTGPDGSALFQLADGSKFEVFPKSHVIFRNNRGDWRDLLEVLIGKVRVEIEKLGGQPNYNRVRTATAVISVRGTVFDVDVEDEDATTLVLVEEGQVEVRHLLRPGNGKLLNPGEWLRVYKNQPIAAQGRDRGAVLQRAARAAADALYEALLRNTQGTGHGTTGTGATVPADGCKGSGCPSSTAPPPPPPPPQPPQ